MNSDQQMDVYVVCIARYHDTNSARLGLLKLLAENENINIKVADSFRDVETVANSKLLLTYTCDLRPTLLEQEALFDFISIIANSLRFLPLMPCSNLYLVGICPNFGS